MTRRIAHAAQIGALVLVLILVPVGLAAAKGGQATARNGTGTISLVLLNSTDGLPHVGQKVTFNVVTVDYYDNGVWEYHASNGIFPTSLNQVFTLASNTWMSGPADCTAYLENWDSYSKNGKTTTLTSTSFHVNA
jgi:hypothetical protein